MHRFRSLSIPATALAIVCALAPAPARALRPGDLVTSFAQQGYQRIPFDRANESAFDSAHFVVTRYETSPGFPVAFPYIYVAGIAGDRAAIIKLNGDGTLVSGFGDNGRVVSTQYGLGNLAGLGFAPNGDVVIGYSTNFVGDALAHVNGEDFFVEVFTRDGQPRVQQQTFYFGDFLDVNWVGVNVVDYGNGAFCDPDDYSLSSSAHSMAQAQGGNLSIAGVVEHSAVRPEIAPYYSETVAARFWFDTGAGVYRVWNGSNRYPFGTAADSCMGTGGFGYYAEGDGESTLTTQWATAAAYLTPDDLRVAGPMIDPGNPRRYGAYHALPVDPGTVYADSSGSAWVPNTAYWGADTRNTEFHAMQWVPERPNLFLYGFAEDGFYAGGNKLKPIIAFDNGTQSLAPRWAFLNAEMNEVYSAYVQNGFHLDGKHTLLGPLRLCAEINDCAGEWDGWFLSRTGGEPDTLAFPPDLSFGDNGSRAYRVPGNSSGIPAERAWAWDGAVLASNLIVPGEDPPADLIVVGDFRRAGASDPADFDWFVARVRLRGSPGAVNVALGGGGNGRVTGSPAGIDCPGTCSQSLPRDAEVTLNASASPGSSFSGWTPDSRCLSVVGAQCRVHVDGSQSVTALFTPGENDRIFANGFDGAP